MKKKLLIVKEDFKSYWGINNLLIFLYKELSKHYDITFLSLYKDDKQFSFKQKLKNRLSLNNNIKFFYILNKYFPKRKTLFKEVIKLLFFSYKINKFAKENNIDIIWSHWEYANFANSIFKIFTWDKYKCVWQLHTNPLFLWKKYQKLLRLYNYLDNIIVDSKDIKKILINSFNIKKEKIKVLETFIDIKLINSLRNEKIENKCKETFKKNFIFINVARIVPLKNQLWIIKAFKKFKNDNNINNAKLVFIWNIDDKNYYNILLKEIKDDKDILFLWQQENVFKYLNQSNCFILNSMWEGFPVAVLEALSIWLPTILSDFKTWSREILFDNYEQNKNIEINKYKIADNWVIVPLDNYQELAKAMKEIYFNKKLQKKLKEKWKKLWEKYSIDNYIKKVLSILW